MPVRIHFFSNEVNVMKCITSCNVCATIDIRNVARHEIFKQYYVGAKFRYRREYVACTLNKYRREAMLYCTKLTFKCEARHARKFKNTVDKC